MIVLDCSAAVAMVLGSVEGEALVALTLTGERILAPRLFCAELSHALTKYVKADWFPVDIALEKSRYALGLIDEFYNDDELCIEAISESTRLSHSAYDMYYFILARRTGSTLFTLNKSLAALCEREGVDCVQEVAI